MATTQNFNYPSSSDVTVTGIGNPVGQPFPTSAVPIAGENPAGNLTAIQTNTAGDLIVVSTPATGSLQNVNLTEVGGAAVALGATTASASIPTAMATDQFSTITNIDTQAINTQINTATTAGRLPVTIGQHISAASLAVVIASDQSTVPVSLASVPLPTGAATAALQSSVQGSVTGGTAAVASSLDGGIFNSTAPVLTNGQQAALQLNSQGSLYTALGPDLLTATQSLTTRDTASTTTTGADGQVIITGTPTAGSSANFTINSKGSARVQVNGTWTGTIQSEISFDGGTTWYQNAVHVTGTPVNASSFSANVGALLNTAGATNFRMRMVAPSTGTAVVQINESNSASAVAVLDPVKIVDGTANSSNLLTIKAASTAPVVGDPAVVTVLSPNSTIFGTVGSGTAAIQSVLTGGVFNTVLPTLTNGQQAARQLDSSGRLLVSAIVNSSSSIAITPVEGTLTDGSGTTSATPSTSTQIFASNANRKYLLIENVSATATIYINFTSAATAGAGSYSLLPGGSIVMETTFISTEAVNVLSTVASVPYTAKQA